MREMGAAEMSKIEGEHAEALWLDGAQFVHDLRSRFVTTDTAFDAFMLHWPKMVEHYKASAERGEIDEPLRQKDLNFMTGMVQVMRYESHLARELTNLHWDRLQSGLAKPAETWQGNGAKLVDQAREGVSVEVTYRLEESPKSAKLRGAP